MNAEVKKIEEFAENIARNDVLTLANWVFRALASDGEWVYAGYNYECIENLYTDEDEVREIMQWWQVTPWLADKLREDGAVILETDDGHFWGRCGYGYTLREDFMDIARKVLEV